MIPCIRIKEGVEFKTIAPAGFVLLAAILKGAEALGQDVVITSGTDGCHSGELDPHHSGEAYDVRTHDLTADQKELLLKTIQANTGPLFYAFLEDPAADNEHIHCQRAKGTVYPPA